MTVRWAVAGCSAIADNRVAPAIRRCAEAELVGFSSHDPARAEAFSSRHGAPRSYASFDCLLEDDSIDVVYIGGLNAVHAPQTIAAVRAGRHVLCEKPMATRLADARGMIDACGQNGRLLGINHHLRGAATHAAMRQAIAEGCRSAAAPRRRFRSVPGQLADSGVAEDDAAMPGRRCP